MVKLRCSIEELTEAAVRCLLLRYGCTAEEAQGFAVKPSRDLGYATYLASVHATDGRELFRIYDAEDVDQMLSDNGCGAYLARTIRQLYATLRGAVPAHVG